MLRGIYLLDHFDLIYGSAYKEINKQVHIYAEPQTKGSIKENPSILSAAEIIFSGWGCPVMDQSFLDLAPNLKAQLNVKDWVNTWHKSLDVIYGANH